jgi:hypothetical protein
LWLRELLLLFFITPILSNKNVALVFDHSLFAIAYVIYLPLGYNNFNMHTNKQKKLLKLLEAYDLQGVSFYDAKQALIQQGYSVQDIEVVAASAPFDGKKNVPNSPDEMTKLYESNPEEAKKIAQQYMIIDASKQQRKARSNTLLASYQSPIGAGPNPVSVNGVINLADDLGVPLFKLAGLGLFITAILYGLAINQLLGFAIVLGFIHYYIIAVTVLIVGMLIRSEVRYYKLKKAGGEKTPIAAHVLNGVAIVLLLLLGLTTYLA